jgi:hypothetical protein
MARELSSPGDVLEAFQAEMPYGGQVQELRGVIGSLEISDN